MRSVIPLLIVGALTGCNYAPGPRAPMVDMRAQARLNQLLAGKVPGRPQSCLPHFRADDMVVIDDYTIAFRDGTNRVWINKPPGGCNLLSAGPYALVTRTTVGSTCRGDIATVMDTMNRTSVGSCVFSDFIPYTRPGR
jgi:hypothetical protein